MNNAIEHTVSSGNVFADLRLNNPNELQAHAQLGYIVYRLLKERATNEQDMVELLEVDQSRISRLMNGHFGYFSTDDLLEFLKRLNQKVTIRVRERQQGEAFQEVYQSELTSA